MSQFKIMHFLGEITILKKPVEGNFRHFAGLGPGRNQCGSKSGKLGGCLQGTQVGEMAGNRHEPGL